MSAVLIDISAEQDLRIHGDGAASLLAAACGPAVRGLSIGRSDSVYWCADGGGVRGFGMLSRTGEEEFLLRSSDADRTWFASAAPDFDASVEDVTLARALLLVTGPYAVALMIAAQLEAFPLEAGRYAQHDWRGIPITLFRSSIGDGYELSCAPDDALIVFDRLVRAGRMVRARLAGEHARALLQMETGVPLVHVDFAPAREPNGETPLPAALVLTIHRARYARECADPCGTVVRKRRAGIVRRVACGRNEAGRSLRSLYSPACKGAIALAQLQHKYAAAGTMLTARYTDSSGVREVSARVVPLPFL
jgi:glycine cleavage system aminomethyltransferase T